MASSGPVFEVLTAAIILLRIGGLTRSIPETLIASLQLQKPRRFRRGSVSDPRLRGDDR